MKAVRFDLRPYAGRFSSRWWDVEIVAMDDRLRAFDPSTDRPLRDVNELQRVGRDRFRIVAGLGIGYVGEAVTFETVAGGAPAALRWAPSLIRRATAGRPAQPPGPERIRP